MRQPGRSRALAIAFLLVLATCTEDHTLTAPTHAASFAFDAGTAVTLVGAGAVARCDSLGDQATAALLDTIPGTVFTAGDNIIRSGSVADFTTCYGPSWGRHLARTRPAPGDKEYQTADAAGYFSYFGAAAGDPTKGYYSYDLGAWHVVVLNSSIDVSAGSAQEQWLRADLTATSQPCTLAYWDHPRFSSVYTAVWPALLTAWNDLYAAGAMLVVNGHMRHYERFAPQTPTRAADPQYGIREIVAGTGGLGIDTFWVAQPNSEVRNSGTYGVLKLTLGAAGYDWAFIPAGSGTFTDAGSGTCHGRPPVTAVTVTPTSSSAPVGATLQLSALPSANGVPLFNRVVTWTRSAPAVAAVDATGRVIALSPGTALISATSEGHHGTDTVTVTAVAPTATTSFVLVGAGDIARCDSLGDEATAALLDTIPGTVFTAGNNIIDNGSPTDFTKCYGPTWGRHRSRTRPAPGDKEYQTVGAAGYFGYFGAAAGDPTKGYYSYDLGAWHVVVLNSAIDVSTGSAQEQWLRSDLAVTAQPCTLAYWNYPRFSSVYTAVRSGILAAWNDLYAAGATLVVNGHMRHYERFAPQTPTRAADPQYGIREIIVGTGGLGIDSFWVAQPNSEVRHSGTYGVLKLTLSAGAYSWAFIPAAGGTFSDAGSGACHERPPVNAVTVSPTAPGAFVGATLQLTATPMANGTPVLNRSVTWASTAPTAALVDATGRVSALNPGRATITATSEGRSGAAVVTVVPVPIAAVAVSPGTGALPEGGALQLSATPQDASGNPLAGRVVTWTSSAPAVATVDATGLVGAASPGEATITATSEGKSGATAVTVGAVLVGAGDIAACPGKSEATAALLDTIPGAVLTLGDNAYPDGTPAEYLTCYDPSWGRHKARTHPVPGNHDYVTAGAAGYYGYFGLLAGDPTKGYYSYDLGAWHIIALNGEISAGAGSAQEVWLKADLAASTQTCTLAYIHRPRFSAGFHGSNAFMQPLWQDLYDAGAELYVAGHNHAYERFAPQDANGVADPVRGIRELVVGTGGAGSEAWSTTPPIANEEVWANPTWGVLKLTLYPTSYTWQYIPVAGDSFTDSGSGSCH